MELIEPNNLSRFNQFNHRIELNQLNFLCNQKSLVFLNKLFVQTVKYGIPNHIIVFINT